jgi:hypothetical protein
MAANDAKRAKREGKKKAPIFPSSPHIFSFASLVNYHNYVAVEES